MLCLKAIISFVSEMKRKYDMNGNLDWQTTVGHFADATVAEKKLAKKNATKRNVTVDAEHKAGNVAKAKASPAQQKSTKSKDKPVTPTAQKSSKVKPTPVKPSKVKKSKEIAENAEEPATTTTVDPFFITNDGSNYISTAVIDRTQPDGPDDQLNRRSRRANRLNNNRAEPKPHAINRKFNKATPKLKSFGGTFRNEVENDVTQNADADVHPSWSAKRKQKTIPPFQGKKMKFVGSEDKPVAGSTKSSNQTEDTSKLHPSWAAKQKLKPVITAFKGSKITFD